MRPPVFGYIWGQTLILDTDVGEEQSFFTTPLFFFFELHVVDTITVESSGSLAKQQLHILSNASKSDLFLRQRALKPELSQTDQIL